MIGERSVEIVHNGGYNTTPLGLTPASRRLSRLLAAEPPCCAGSRTLRRTNVSVSAKTRERRRLTEVAAPNGARLWAAWGRETQVCGPVTLCFDDAHGARPGPPAQGLQW